MDGCATTLIFISGQSLPFRLRGQSHLVMELNHIVALLRLQMDLAIFVSMSIDYLTTLLSEVISSRVVECTRLILVKDGFG
jgi:hypothetical protein